MKKKAAGSLMLYFPNPSPGADKESNWLPSLNGANYLVMRLSWPKIEAPLILTPVPGTWKAPGVVAVN